MTTQEQFQQVMAECRTLFAQKLHDYGAAWRIMRPSSITDQIFIKANRIRSLETKGVSLVGEGIRPEFIGIVNYALIGLIQLELGYSDKADSMSAEEPWPAMTVMPRPPCSSCSARTMTTMRHGVACG